MPDTCWHLLPAGEKMLGGPQARPIPIVTQYSPRRHQAMRYFCTQYICSALIPHVLCSLSELNSDLGHTHAFDWSRKWQPTLVFLPGEFHGQRSLAGYTVHGVAKSQTWLSNCHSLTHLMRSLLHIFVHRAYVPHSSVPLPKHQGQVLRLSKALWVSVAAGWVLHILSS